MSEVLDDNVVFDVGGIIYKFPRSLLRIYPDTMLAKLVSKEWNSDGDDRPVTTKPIFLDRNGYRFKFVLDYMRDQKVVLPYHVSKGELLLDFEYLGLMAYVDQDNIVAEHQSIEAFKQAKEHSESLLRKGSEQLGYYEQRAAIVFLAKNCYESITNCNHRFPVNRSLSFGISLPCEFYFSKPDNQDRIHDHDGENIVEYQRSRIVHYISKHSETSEMKAFLDEEFARYGLKYIQSTLDDAIYTKKRKRHESITIEIGVICKDIQIKSQST